VGYSGDVFFRSVTYGEIHQQTNFFEPFHIKHEQHECCVGVCVCLG